jgi:hypothetical protein
MWPIKRNASFGRHSPPGLPRRGRRRPGCARAGRQRERRGRLLCCHLGGGGGGNWTRGRGRRLGAGGMGWGFMCVQAAPPAVDKVWQRGAGQSANRFYSETRAPRTPRAVALVRLLPPAAAAPPRSPRPLRARPPRPHPHPPPALPPRPARGPRRRRGAGAPPLAARPAVRARRGEAARQDSSCLFCCAAALGTLPPAVPPAPAIRGAAPRCSAAPRCRHVLLDSHCPPSACVSAPAAPNDAAAGSFAL